MPYRNFLIVSGTGYGSGLNYNSGYGTGTYSSYGSGGMYGGGLYGNNMYRGGYGGLYGGGMYGGGMYNSGLGGQMGGYGMGMGMGMGMGGPYGEQDPNNPFGAPSSPPGFWVSLMRVVSLYSLRRNSFCLSLLCQWSRIYQFLVNYLLHTLLLC